MTRAQLGLLPPRSISTRIKPTHLTAHWTGPSPNLRSEAQAASIWRGFQRYHLSKGWADIAYNWGITPGGTILEGRGYNRRSAANGTNTGNSNSYAACYLGGEGDPLTDAAKHAFRDIAARAGVPLDRVHNQWKSTACPGAALTQWVVHEHAAIAQTPPPPPADIDWAALRRLAATALRAPLGDQPTIKAGSPALRIALLQQVLNLITGTNLAVDGKWGPATETAVRNFQKFFALVDDGIFGPQSRFVACVVLDRIKAGAL